MRRCAWAGDTDTQMIQYHDTKWGVPTHNDRVLFEFLILEGAQAGLSWSTILHKREGYKKVFKHFDPKQVVKMTKTEVSAALRNPNIVRNKLKVASTTTNAKCFLEVQKEFGSFATYLWQFVDQKTIQNKWKNSAEVPAVTPLAEQISKDLKKRGFCFVGPTIIYAYMQAVGVVNDHTTDCFRHELVKKLTK